ncbi:MAG: carbon-nitrogen hydrolase family protein, partial [Betaproteobacteria bacterium]|nr:carbon-nitrogen hydrolase family protein [Betaproteobacteria bacterium]
MGRDEASAMRVAAIQMTSGADVGENLRQAEGLVDAAAREAAELVLLPENFGLMGLHARDKLAAQEE